MPEGHVIRIEADRQGALLAGRKVRVTSPQGRFAGAAEVDGRVLRAIEGAGKLLFYDFGAGRIVYVHLGRLGGFQYHDADAPPATAGTRMRLAARGGVVDLSGPIACKLVTREQRAAMLAKLGPDPLRADADPELAWARTHKSRKAIGALLLDQSIYAGVGNIFRAEALYRIGLRPDVRGNALSRGRFDALWADLVVLMRRAVGLGNIVGPDLADLGRKAYGKVTRADRFLVYRRETCRRFGHALGKPTVGGRTCYFCPTCQRGE